MPGLIFTIRVDNEHELTNQILARQFDEIGRMRVEAHALRTGRTIIGPHWISEFRVPWERCLDFIKAVVEAKKRDRVKIVGVRGWE